MNLSRTLFVSVFYLFCFSFLQGQSLSILTWNIQDLGKTKNAEEIKFMAKIMNDYDIITIQEVVAIDPAGAKAVAQIADQLNRSGAKWDYKVSVPTTGTSQQKERYAFIWKTSSVKLIGRAWLEKSLAPIVCREPYLARFKFGDFTFLLANYHSIPHSKKPQWENEQVIQLPKLYPNDEIIIAGDFNTNSTDKFWNQLDQHDLSIQPMGKKTTLNRACTNSNKYSYKRHAIDFFIYENSELNIIQSGVLDYVESCERLKIARSISDHLPAWCKISWSK